MTLKPLLHTKYGWNNPNWGRLGLKCPKLHFLAISGSSKIIAYTNIQIHVTRSIFIVNWFFFFEMLVTMSSIRINNNWNYQNLLITAVRSLSARPSRDIRILKFHQLCKFCTQHCVTIFKTECALWERCIIRYRTCCSLYTVSSMGEAYETFYRTCCSLYTVSSMGAAYNSLPDML